MKKRLARIAKIVELSRLELDVAVKALKSITSQVQVHIKQLETLKEYQTEYLIKLTSNRTTTLQEINQVQAFLIKLNQAVAHQANEVSQLEESLKKIKNNWIEKHTRTQALEKLYQKIEKKHLVKLDKDEQKMMDDLVTSRLSFSKNAY